MDFASVGELQVLRQQTATCRELRRLHRMVAAKLRDGKVKLAVNSEGHLLCSGTVFRLSNTGMALVYLRSEMSKLCITLIEGEIWINQR